ncbi:hypothetical protein MMPV_003299 [Pyropia vietnamensis]
MAPPPLTEDDAAVAAAKAAGNAAFAAGRYAAAASAYTDALRALPPPATLAATAPGAGAVTAAETATAAGNAAGAAPPGGGDDRDSGSSLSHGGGGSDVGDGDGADDGAGNGGAAPSPPPLLCPRTPRYACGGHTHPPRAVLAANRAAARLVLGDYDGAVADAAAGLATHPPPGLAAKLRLRAGRAHFYAARPAAALRVLVDDNDTPADATVDNGGRRDDGGGGDGNDGGGSGSAAGVVVATTSTAATTGSRRPAAPASELATLARAAAWAVGYRATAAHPAPPRIRSAPVETPAPFVPVHHAAAPVDLVETAAHPPRAVLLAAAGGDPRHVIETLPLRVARVRGGGGDLPPPPPLHLTYQDVNATAVARAVLLLRAVADAGTAAAEAASKGGEGVADAATAAMAFATALYAGANLLPSQLDRLHTILDDLIATTEGGGEGGDLGHPALRPESPAAAAALAVVWRRWRALAMPWPAAQRAILRASAAAGWGAPPPLTATAGAAAATAASTTSVESGSRNGTVTPSAPVPLGGADPAAPATAAMLAALDAVSEADLRSAAAGMRRPDGRLPTPEQVARLSADTIRATLRASLLAPPGAVGGSASGKGGAEGGDLGMPQPWHPVLRREQGEGDVDALMPADVPPDLAADAAAFVASGATLPTSAAAAAAAIEARSDAGGSGVGGWDGWAVNPTLYDAALFRETGVLGRVNPVALAVGLGAGSDGGIDGGEGDNGGGAPSVADRVAAWLTPAAAALAADSRLVDIAFRTDALFGEGNEGATMAATAAGAAAASRGSASPLPSPAPPPRRFDTVWVGVTTVSMVGLLPLLVAAPGLLVEPLAGAKADAATAADATDAVARARTPLLVVCRPAGAPLASAAVASATLRSPDQLPESLGVALVPHPPGSDAVADASSTLRFVVLPRRATPLPAAVWDSLAPHRWLRRLAARIAAPPAAADPSLAGGCTPTLAVWAAVAARFAHTAGLPWGWVAGRGGAIIATAADSDAANDETDDVDVADADAVDMGLLGMDLRVAVASLSPLPPTVDSAARAGGDGGAAAAAVVAAASPLRPLPTDTVRLLGGPPGAATIGALWVRDRADVNAVMRSPAGATGLRALVLGGGGEGRRLGDRFALSSAVAWAPGGNAVMVWATRADWAAREAWAVVLVRLDLWSVLVRMPTLVRDLRRVRP